MKRIFIILTYLININCVLSQTTISGGAVSGSWGLSGSPYIVHGSIVIPNNSTLTISPGVVVNFQGTFKILVSGQLIAIGSLSDSIFFTVSDTTNGWLGIEFDNTAATNDTSKISFCKIEYGKATSATPDNNGGGLYFSNFSKAIVSHCLISHCYANIAGGGIYCYNSSPQISFNTINYCYSGGFFLESGGAISCLSGSNPTISNNLIVNNQGVYNGGIFCFQSNPNILRNKISFNQCIGIGYGGGVYLVESSPNISDNVISNNIGDFGGGITCFGGSPHISNNLISNNNTPSQEHGGGILLDSYLGIYSNPLIINNTIVNNASGNGGALYCSDNSNPTLINNILWGNTASSGGNQVYLKDQGSNPNIYNCDIQGGVADFDVNNNVYTGTYQNNLNSDPLFVSPSLGASASIFGINANWSLTANSPCIKAGDISYTSYPLLDLAGNPRVSNGFIDIGAYEYHAVTGLVKTKMVFEPCFNIYPNPVQNNTTIFFPKYQNNSIVIIRDIVGSEIYSSNVNGNKLNLDRGVIASGIYFLEVNKDRSCSAKIVFE